MVAERRDGRTRDTRERMIRATIDLFRVRGLRGTGFTEVLAATGAARGAIYHHFPGGKDELAVAAIDQAGLDVAKVLTRLLERSSPGVAIGEFANWYADQFERKLMRFGCPLAPAVLEVDSETAIAQAAARAFASWQILLRDSLESRAVSRERADLLATLVIAGFEGALLLCRAEGSAQPIRRVGAELAGLLDSAVATSE